MSTPTGPDDSTQVLTSLREHRAVRDRAEIAILSDVLDWCVLHQTDDEGDAAFGDHGIPLADHIHVAAYEVPDRLVEQDALVDHHCVFPWCTRPAARCDIDHAVPYGEGGPTCSCNTAPLCRGHHRLKTHGGWTYDVLDRGIYLWHTPHGHLFRRDHTGTEPLDPPHRRRS